MKNRINPRDKIVQRSIGFNFRQIEFFNEHQDFKPDEYCRLAIDEQISIIDERFLKETNGHNTDE
jgi:hypothetical protein